MNHDISKSTWHHGPPHLFVPHTMYMVTASTWRRQHFFSSNERLAFLQEAIFEVTNAYHWPLQAWAVLANHYHFIAQSPGSPRTLKLLIQRLHSQTARQLNRADGVSGRQIWFQYWDSCLNSAHRYYACLHYVHHNAEKHGLVKSALEYPFCSATWFYAQADQDLLAELTVVAGDDDLSDYDTNLM